MFDINFDEVEDLSSGLAAGKHVLTVTAAELKETKAKTGMYIKVEFTAENGQKHWENFNIQNPNEKAQKIGLGQLKAFAKAAKFPGTRLNDVNAMIGLKVEAEIKLVDEPGYGKQPRVKSYKEVSGEAALPSDNVFG